jgi:formate-dependent nitrite reductase membrane component NrfD
VFLRRAPKAEQPVSGWVLIALGLVVVGLAVGAFLAYSYWEWRGRRIEGFAVLGVPTGLVLVVWGVVLLVRDAVRRRRARRDG